MSLVISSPLFPYLPISPSPHSPSPHPFFRFLGLDMQQVIAVRIVKANQWGVAKW